MTVIDRPARSIDSGVTHDLYRDVHKGIRSELFGLTSEAGRLDPGDGTARVALARRVSALRELLVSHAAHEFAEAGPLASIEGPLLWSTRDWLPEDSGLGSILRALLGYADSPHAIDVVAYVLYFVGVWLFSKTNLIRPVVHATAEATRPA